MSSGQVRISQQIVDVQERQSLRVGFTWLDETNTPIPLADVTSLTLSLRNPRTGDMLNSRDGQDVLNTNGVTFDATTGETVWEVTPDDLTIVDDTLDIEERHGLFRLEWGVNKAFEHRVVLRAANLYKDA
jgi:hypothetical protein